MKKVQIIAEAGVNHNGNLGTALKLVDAAIAAKANIIKFQTFRAEKVISRFAEKAEYQKMATSEHESQLEMVKKLELDINDHEKLIKYCTQKGIEFLSTPFDLESIDLLDQLELKTLKIPSGEINNLPYLRKIGGLKKKIILSSGMSTLEEIRDALEVLSDSGTRKEDIVVLHCNTEYPTPFKDVNLKAMQTIKDELGVKIGYSDHSLGIEVSIAAIALGAEIIEKHFTLDRNMEGPDHRASLMPEELKNMVSAIRNIEEALGDGIKKPSPSETKNMRIARKSIVAAKHIKKGDQFSDQNITTKRPGHGINPMSWDQIIGQKAIHDYSVDELIEMNELKSKT